MIPFGRISACLSALSFCIRLVAADSGDSPILDLDEVIGIEIQRTSLSERVMEEGKKTELVVDEDHGTNFGLIRRFDQQVVDYTSIRIRAANGGWANAMMVVPKGFRSPPAVFLMDEECRYLQFLMNLPERADIDDFEGRIYSRIPLGSHLIGSGFAVAFPTPETMSNGKGSMTLEDWIGLIKRFEGKARIDSESLFLVATHEHAELALRLTARMDFAGVVIEAPRKMMFVDSADRLEKRESRKKKSAGNRSEPAEGGGHEDDWKESFFHSETHMIYYLENARSLKAPALIILAKEAPDFERTKKTWLASLVAAHANFSAVLLDRWARVPMRREAQTRDWIRNEEEPDRIGSPSGAERHLRVFRYDEEQFERWIAQMGHFLVEHSRTQPRSLPLPKSNLRKRGGKSDDVFNRLDGFSEPEEPNLDDQEDFGPSSGPDWSADNEAVP